MIYLEIASNWTCLFFCLPEASLSSELDAIRNPTARLVFCQRAPRKPSNSISGNLHTILPSLPLESPQSAKIFHTFVHNQSYLLTARAQSLTIYLPTFLTSGVCLAPKHRRILTFAHQLPNSLLTPNQSQLTFLPLSPLESAPRAKISTEYLPSRTNLQAICSLPTQKLDLRTPTTKTIYSLPLIRN